MNTLERTPPSPGDVVHIRVDLAARVVAHEVHVDLPTGWPVRVDEYLDELHQAVVHVTRAGPLVWVDVDDLVLGRWIDEGRAAE